MEETPSPALAPAGSGTTCAYAALDRAVWDAYGWDDSDPASVEEDTILARLLALNLERSGAASQVAGS